MFFHCRGATDQVLRCKSILSSSYEFQWFGEEYGWYSASSVSSESTHILDQWPLYLKILLTTLFYLTIVHSLHLLNFPSVHFPVKIWFLFFKCPSSNSIFYMFINDGVLEKEWTLQESSRNLSKKVSTFPFVLSFNFSQRFVCVSAEKSSGIYDLHLLSVQSASSLAAHKLEGEILSKELYLQQTQTCNQELQIRLCCRIRWGFRSDYRGWIDGSTIAPTKSSTGIVFAVKRVKLYGFQGRS